MSIPSNHALIIFAKRPSSGRVKTRLVPFLTQDQAAGLYECMLKDTLENTALLTAIDRFLFYDDEAGALEYFNGFAPDMTLLPQKGNDLGERMADSFNTLFKLNYQKVAIIGSDSPDLPLEYMENGLALLAEEGNDVAFGPSRDGGYYLVAMKELHEELFRDIEWSSSKVLEQSIAKARGARLRVAILPEWHDLDTVEDLQLFRSKETAGEAINTMDFLRELGF